MRQMNTHWNHLPAPETSKFNWNLKTFPSLFQCVNELPQGPTCSKRKRQHSMSNPSWIFLCELNKSTLVASPECRGNLPKSKPVPWCQHMVVLMRVSGVESMSWCHHRKHNHQLSLLQNVETGKKSLDVLHPPIYAWWVKQTEGWSLLEC